MHNSEGIFVISKRLIIITTIIVKVCDRRVVAIYTSLILQSLSCSKLRYQILHFFSLQFLHKNHHYYTQMGNGLRCCLACVLPCGALDLIRIVHLNGFVEELTGPITADEVLKANPNHVLTRPTSQGVVRRILVLSPDTELKRGSIYFLIPSSSVPENKKTSSKKNKIGKKISLTDLSSKCDDTPLAVELSADVASSEKKSSRRDRRSCHSGIWRPHLESISED